MSKATANPDLRRSAGVLLHPTSLPGGRLGDEAYAFVDWLAAAGQSWWQVLPLGPPDDTARRTRRRPRSRAGRGCSPTRTRRSTRRSSSASSPPTRTGSGTGPRSRASGAIADQVRFEREWDALRAYAAERGVRLIGDLPIYVADGGADHATWPELFQDGYVGGVPPDDFSADGQLWGNPLYDWHTMRETGFRWWVERFRRTFELVDLTRVDHFRGFVAYWAVPAEATTARAGVWRRAPGRELFETVRRELGRLPLIAEDLGVITPPVERLRDGFGLPGMHVLQWGLPPDPRSPHSPANHRERGVVYTGTHDNDTSLGWWESLDEDTRVATGLDPDDPAWSMIEVALSSRARLAIVPLQDVLGLGSEARMNTPGSMGGNWSWRLEKGQLTDAHAERLRAATQAAGRLTR